MGHQRGFAKHTRSIFLSLNKILVVKEQLIFREFIIHTSAAQNDLVIKNHVKDIKVGLLKQWKSDLVRMIQNKQADKFSSSICIESRPHCLGHTSIVEGYLQEGVLLDCRRPLHTGDTIRLSTNYN